VIPKKVYIQLELLFDLYSLYKCILRKNGKTLDLEKEILNKSLKEIAGTEEIYMEII
jgi:hypothetical protein